MRRMWTKKRIIKLIEEHGGGVSPESLLANMIGSDFISVDYDESGKKVKIDFDFTDIRDFAERLGLSQVVFDGTIDFTDTANPVVDLGELDGKALYQGLMLYHQMFNRYPKVILQLESETQSLDGVYEIEMNASRTRDSGTEGEKIISLMGSAMMISGIPSSVRDNTIAIQMSIENRDEVSVKCKAWTDLNPSK